MITGGGPGARSHGSDLYQAIASLPEDARDALIAVDIERLSFVHVYNIGKHDDDYMQALSRITEKYPASPAAAEAWTAHARGWFARYVTDPAQARFPVAEVDGELVATAIGTPALRSRAMGGGVLCRRVK